MNPILTYRNILKLKRLASEYSSGHLSVFLGAGVSQGCGLSGWKALQQGIIEHMLAKSNRSNDGYSRALIKNLESLISELPLLTAGRYIKRNLGEEYISTLRDILYQKDYAPSESLVALARLTLLKAVCTYNYDDLLEVYPDASRLFCSIASASDRPHIDAIPVYHVHGLLPSATDASARGDLVFAEDEYHQMYRHFSHWSNTTQLTLLRETSSLFFGLSFSDPNLRRMLEEVSNENPASVKVALMRRPEDPPDSHGGYIFHFQRMVFHEDILQDLGVETLWIDDYDTDIPLVLDALASDCPTTHYVRGMLRSSEARYLEARKRFLDDPWAASPEIRWLANFSEPDQFRRSFIIRRLGFPLAALHLEDEMLSALTDEEVEHGRKCASDTEFMRKWDAVIANNKSLLGWG